jgi:hypothetical protein
MMDGGVPETATESAVSPGRSRCRRNRKLGIRREDSAAPIELIPSIDRTYARTHVLRFSDDAAGLIWRVRQARGTPTEEPTAGKPDTCPPQRVSGLVAAPGPKSIELESEQRTGCRRVADAMGTELPARDTSLAARRAARISLKRAWGR